jgi:hypothetical protein
MKDRLFSVRLVLLILAAGAAAGCLAQTRQRRASAAAAQAETPRFEQLVVAGEVAKNGIFDPSIEYGPDGVGWLAYSRVRLPEYVDTHLAKSTDHGATWTYVASINESAPDTITIGGKSRKAFWRYETSTLVYDATDNPARRWKLFAERYPSVPPHKAADNLHAEGWIEYKYAADPAGPWSQAVRLFGSRANGCLIDLNDLHPDLRDMKFYYELGSVFVDGTLYLSMDASPTVTGLGDWEKRKIILIASADHGNTWKYVGTLTDYADAHALGYLVLTGSSLVKVGPRLFLLATPSGGGLFKKLNRHNGTFVIELTDIARAKLARDASGRLVISQRLEPPLTSGGQADYDEQNTAGGIVFPQINLKARPSFFQIYSTHERIAVP